jgi:hypothetical protein
MANLSENGNGQESARAEVLGVRRGPLHAGHCRSQTQNKRPVSHSGQREMNATSVQRAIGQAPHPAMRSSVPTADLMTFRQATEHLITKSVRPRNRAYPHAYISVRVHANGRHTNGSHQKTKDSCATKQSICFRARERAPCILPRASLRLPRPREPKVEQDTIHAATQPTSLQATARAGELSGLGLLQVEWSGTHHPRLIKRK